MKVKLTERNADSLRAPKKSGQKSGGVNAYYRDTEVQGFALRVGASGARFWIIEYSLGKRQRTYVIGKRELYTADAARTEAKKLLGDVAKGIDPAQSKRAAVAAQAERDGTVTFTELYDLWLAEVGVNKKSAANDRSSRKKFASLENMKASDITTAHIEAVLAGLVKGNKPIAANRALALVKTVCRWGVRKHHLDSDPAKDIKKPAAESERVVFISRAELDKLYGALDAHPDTAGANAIKLLVWTGCRKREVIGARWDQFDLERGLFQKGVTKSGREVFIPLDPLALDLLREMKRAATSEWLFPSRTKKDISRDDVRRVWYAARAAIGRGELHVHDIRHFYSTALLEAGAAPHLIAPMLGHRTTAMTQRYAHIHADHLIAERAKLTLSIGPAAPKRIAPPAKRGSHRKARRRRDEEAKSDSAKVVHAVARRGAAGV